MKKLPMIDLVSEFAKTTKKPCIYISFDLDLQLSEVVKACPCLELGPINLEDSEILFRGKGVIVCDNANEMQTVFENIVGDEGPTKTNDYKGPASVYALTFNSKGEMETENT